ncbi:MAG TPA: hypothetical protein VGI86_11120 [Acidimicrobiia bacterium]|jgi:hypothetical protein
MTDPKTTDSQTDDTEGSCIKAGVTQDDVANDTEGNYLKVGVIQDAPTDDVEGNNFRVVRQDSPLGEGDDTEGNSAKCF